MATIHQRCLQAFRLQFNPREPITELDKSRFRADLDTQSSAITI